MRNSERFSPRFMLWSLGMLLPMLPMGGAVAQLGGFDRSTTPNGRVVLEIRKGTHPTSPNLLFTAAITVGPTSGTTSLLLQQAQLQDIFNAAVPAAGWTVVRSSMSGFSLGGGCGRSNQIDFPYINNNRPEILRVTGTTGQVITPTISNSDQYDSVDCVVQGNGQVLYMLTNRTQGVLELRREQSGSLILVRNNFGSVITPFVGGVRPSIAKVRRPSVFTSTGLHGPDGTALQDDFVIFFVPALLPQSQIVKLLGILDDEPLTSFAQCDGATSPAPAGFTIPKESAVADGVAVASSRNTNVLWGDYFHVGSGNCEFVGSPESFGSSGPFNFYSWGGVAANRVYAGAPQQRVSGRADHVTVIVPGNVVVIEGNQRQSISSPFASRGGPLAACPITSSEIDAAQLAIGVGSTNLQVQHSIININLQETLFGSSFEDLWSSLSRCE